MTNIAVIGLGSMGMGMAACLVRAGFPTAGTDVVEAARTRFAAAGGRAASSVGDACREAEIAFVVVVNAKQARDVILGPQGVADSMPRGGIVICCVTLSPAEAKALAAGVAERGHDYLDAPISGGAIGAESGQLTYMLSGAPVVIERARPAIAATAKKIYELGTEPGVGSAYKIVNQLLAGAHVVIAAEAMAFAKRMGLDLETVYDVITSSAGNSWMFENRMKHVIAGDYTPRSAVDIFVKDLGIVNEISRDLRMPVPLAAAAYQMMLMTAGAGMARDDDSSVARLYARLSGVDLPGDK